MIFKKLQILFFLIIIFSLDIKSQDINEFYFETNRARKLGNAGKLDSAITVYENAFKKVNYVFNSYLRDIKELAELNNDEERVKKYTQQIKKQENGTNPRLRAIIDSLIIVDQQVRTGKLARKARYAQKCDCLPKCNKQSRRYKKSKKASDNWAKIDSLNTYYLLSLFNKYGFIGEELVGEEGFVHVSSMLLHYDQDTNNTVLEPILNKAYREGRIEPYELAMILDRHLGGKYTIQKYWCWPYIGKEKLQFTEEDIPEIIKLRESIGLYDLDIKQERAKFSIYTIFYGRLWVLVNTYK